MTDLNYIALASEVRNLLHLLQFAEISTPTGTDAEQAQATMKRLKEMLDTQTPLQVSQTFSGDALIAITLQDEEHCVHQVLWSKKDCEKQEGKDV